MFVRQSKYHAALVRAMIAETRHSILNDKWNDLIDRINNLGGEAFLNQAKIPAVEPFTKTEIDRLIMLCHPDKHDGKPMATEMTQKLLKMKG